MRSHRQPILTIVRRPTIATRPILSFSSTRAMLQQCRAIRAGATCRRGAAMWRSWSVGSERSIWASGHSFRAMSLRVDQKYHCDDRPALQITLLRLREALISCLEQQRAEVAR